MAVLKSKITEQQRDMLNDVRIGVGFHREFATNILRAGVISVRQNALLHSLHDGMYGYTRYNQQCSGEHEATNSEW